MRILIDYDCDIPDEHLVTKMDQLKQIVLDKLSPIIDEIKESEGVLLLHVDGSYEVKETRIRLHNKIIDLLDSDF